MVNSINDYSKETITEMHNTLMSFILILLEKQKNNKITIKLTTDELESTAKAVLEHEYTLNTLFDPILDEEDEVIGVELVLERLNRNELLVAGLFGNQNDILM